MFHDMIMIYRGANINVLIQPLNNHTSEKPDPILVKSHNSQKTLGKLKSYHWVTLNVRQENSSNKRLLNYILTISSTRNLAKHQHRKFWTDSKNRSSISLSETEQQNENYYKEKIFNILPLLLQTNKFFPNHSSENPRLILHVIINPNEFCQPCAVVLLPPTGDVLAIFLHHQPYGNCLKPRVPETSAKHRNSNEVHSFFKIVAIEAASCSTHEASTGLVNYEG